MKVLHSKLGYGINRQEKDSKWPIRSWLSIVFVAWFLLAPARVYGQLLTVQLEVKNLNSQQTKSVLESISLYRQRNSPFLTDDYINRLFKRGEQEISTTMQVYGFYKVTVTSHLEHNDNKWRAIYNVDSGPAIKVRQVDVDVRGDGSSDEKLREWVSGYPLKTGERLNHLQYEQAKNKLLGILSARGYFKAKLLKHQIQISMGDYYSNIVVHVETGPRHRFGDVTFVQETFANSYLQRFVPFEKGEYFSGEALSEVQKNLASSGEFQSVEIKPLIEAVTGISVPIRITPEPRKPTRYTFGVGYGTDTGPRARVGVERRQITATGHKADAEVFASDVRTRLTANYRIPLTKPPQDYLLFSGERLIEETDATYSESNTVSTSTVYGLKDWRRKISVSYLSEIYTVSDERRESALLIPGITFYYEPASVREFTQQFDYRWRFSIGAKGAHEDVASDISFVQSRLSLGNRFKVLSNLNLVSRVDVGWTWVENFAELPVSQRFFAGGDQSVRGFEYQSIGPEDAEGNVIGGDRLLVGSVELQYQFSQDKDVAVFYDSGNAYTGSELQIENGVGIGMGWSLPFGVLRAYIANAISEPDNPWRLHVIIGADW